MYSPFTLAIKYLRYYIAAANGKGHGIHSPFVFEFVKKILNDKKQYQCYSLIETQRQQLLQNNSTIQVQDFGAGSAVIKTSERIVSKIASSSLKPRKYAQLLYRMVQYYTPATIVELGTSFGITTSYLANGNSGAKVYTCEGAAGIAYIAQQTFSVLGIKNIQLLQGDFTTTLPLLMQQTAAVDFVFIDGNHRYTPTVAYFEQLLTKATPQTIFIFDDIHWSAEMEKAWNVIKAHTAVHLTIDLFFIGIVCINNSFKQKQHFTIRY
jgi:predicted O-methyltransferase YrrM